MPTRNGHARTKRRSHRRPNGPRLRKQAMQVGGDLQEMGSIARDTARAKLDELRDNASDYYDFGRQKMHEMERSLEQYICDQPVKSVLIAAGVGLLIGRFVMRR